MTVGQANAVMYDGDRRYDPIVVCLETSDWSQSWRCAEVGQAISIANKVIVRHEPIVVRLRDGARSTDATSALDDGIIERRLRRTARRVGAELAVVDSSQPVEEP